MRIETDKIRQAVRLLNLEYSQRETAKQVSISRDSVKVIYEKYEKLSLANSHDEEKKDNHNKPPNIEIRIVNVTRVKTQKAKKAKRN